MQICDSFNSEAVSGVDDIRSRSSRIQREYMMHPQLSPVREEVCYLTSHHMQMMHCNLVITIRVLRPVSLLRLA